jgi:hypothetical protein
MQTPFPPVDLEYFPLSCTVCLSQEGMIGTGKVWAFYPESCHVESALAISPGMVVSLSLDLPGRARIMLKPGVVTWARTTEFGLRFLHGPATMTQERSTL